MPIDFSLIASHALSQASSLLPQWFPAGRVVGNEFRIGNLNGDAGNSLSVNISTGVWTDFAAPGVGGQDLISLYADSRGLKQSEAAREIFQSLGLAREFRPTTQSKASEKPAAADTLPEIVIPVPADAPPIPTQRPVKTDEGWQRYDIQQSWPYCGSKGDLLGYVVRYETPTGKETPPLTLWRQPSGNLKWRFKGFPNPRPLYGLDRLAAAPGAQVVIVEGEKCADALQSAIQAAGAASSMVAMSWPGGGKSVKKCDWVPMRERRVILWPDSDVKLDKITGELMPPEKQPGHMAMISVAGQLHKLNCKMLWIKTQPDRPDGWDVADAIQYDNWALPEIMQFLRKNRTGVPDSLSPKQVGKPEQSVENSEKPAENASNRDIQAVKQVNDIPFRCLGFNHGYYYYLPNGTRQVQSIKGEYHTSGALRTLADITWWEREYPGQNGPCWSYAANMLMRKNEKIGVYDPDRQRGRGAWYDKGRIVLHLGDQVIVDGERMPIHQHQTRYIYEAAAPIEHLVAAPLVNSEAVRLRKICDSLFWEKPIHGTLLAGWCVIAPICGALKYRPHVWITGGAGTGKTYVLENIVEPCLGETALQVSSSTTSAGIRQKLRTDALPVIFDEFEADEVSDRQRIQSVLELARQAFSDSGAKIIKGSTGGKAIDFQTRSCFCWSSIAVNLGQHADETRVAVLSLQQPYDRDGISAQQHFESLQALVHETITEEWAAGLRARAIRLAPVIRANAATFSKAVASRLGKQRAGDQLGSLLAGAYSLVSSNEISLADAKKWVSEQDWSEQEKTMETGDERKCLDAILAHTVRVKGGEEISVAELLIGWYKKHVEIADPDIDEMKKPHIVEDAVLMRYGIRYEHDDSIIYFSNSHPGLKRILARTPWEKTFGRILRRLTGAEEKACIRFFGSRTRAVGLPWDVVME